MTGGWDGKVRHQSSEVTRMVVVMISVHSIEEILNDIYPFHNLDNLDKSSIVQVLVKGGSWKDGAHISGIVKLIPPLPNIIPPRPED